MAQEAHCWLYTCTRDADPGAEVDTGGEFFCSFCLDKFTTLVAFVNHLAKANKGKKCRLVPDEVVEVAKLEKEKGYMCDLPNPLPAAPPCPFVRPVENQNVEKSKEELLMESMDKLLNNQALVLGKMEMEYSQNSQALVLGKLSIMEASVNQLQHKLNNTEHVLNQLLQKFDSAMGGGQH